MGEGRSRTVAFISAKSSIVVRNTLTLTTLLISDPAGFQHGGQVGDAEFGHLGYA